MLYYGIELALGTEITNLVVERGATNPTGLDAASQGRLFYNTTNGNIDLWNGTNWITIASTTAGVVTSFNTRTGAITLLPSDLTGLINSTNLPIASGSVLGGIKVGSGLSVAVDGTVSTAALSEIAPGTVIMFGQASAPTGWTQITTDAVNNRMLRVVNVAGGTTGSGGTGGSGYGGTHSPTIMNVVPFHTHTISGTAASAGAHSHTYVDWYPNDAVDGPDSTTTHSGDITTRVGTTSIAGAHAHTVSGSTNGGSSQTNWQPRYFNIIACSKN